MGIKPETYDLCDVASKAVPEFASGEWELLSCKPREDAKEHGRSSVRWFSVAYRLSDGHEISEDIVAKLFKTHPEVVSKTYEGIRLLYESGLRPPAPFRVPRPYGYSIEPPVMLIENAPGVSWRELMLRGNGDLESASRRAADWLVSFQECGLHFQPEDTGLLITRLQKLAAKLDALVPDLSPRVTEIVARICRALPFSGRLTPSHGDFRNAHILLTPEFVTGIDFDGLASREPAIDAGFAIGHLLTLSRFETGNYDIGVKAARPFLKQYLDNADPELSRIRLHIGRAILQRAPFVTAKPKPEDVVRWLDLIDQFLDENSKIPLLET